MIKNFVPKIGLEVHCVLNTKSKMFSPSKNSHNDLPNTNIHPIDVAMPGTMPSVNESAVVKAIWLATALKMNIEKEIRFDRKNYFYHDLPKGFQITQQFYPVGTKGVIILNNGKEIQIERIHLEEDTAKEQTINGKRFLDYNRSGMPLIEIVTEPNFVCAQEVLEFLEKLKQILIFCNISDGKMQNGSLRTDVNISVSLYGSLQTGTRVEIKNINSFNNIERAIEFEINDQIKKILVNKEILLQTKRWNEQTNTTEFMRYKSTELDYQFITEPNIISIPLTNEFVQNSIKEMNKTPSEIKDKLCLISNNDDKIVNLLLNNYDLYNIFNKVYKTTLNFSLSVTWVIVELVGYLKATNKKISSITCKQINLICELVNLIKEEEINGRQAKTIFTIMLESQNDPRIIMKKHGILQIKDPVILTSLLKNIIDNNLQLLEQYDQRKERVLKFYLGELMKQTKGQANPVCANKLLLELIIRAIKK